ncbi:MAG TPA: CbiX/SirB N-terminal domain-containing protein [Candidatus Sulfotelmatobacter sp.]|nr:CbiX/SirB N-terminal domain-containing protein [Candidatus Sulfotelmatobacter sp.]
MDEDFSDALLVVMGHGTELNENSAVPVRQHVSELRRRRIFRDVREAFWKQEPQIKAVLAEISAPRIFIAPLFVSEGYFAGQVIPQALGFENGTRTLNVKGSQIHFCRPAGTHDSMTRVILSRAEGILKAFPFPRAPKQADTTLFIAGHGTEKNENSRIPVERQVELIRGLGVYAEVHAIFLEEAPRIPDCYTMARTRNLVIVPFFISDGLHTQEDIPVLLGETKKNIARRLAAGQPVWRNPMERSGKLVWYTAAVGTDAGMVEVILERAREAAHLSV